MHDVCERSTIRKEIPAELTFALVLTMYYDIVSTISFRISSIWLSSLFQDAAVFPITTISRTASSAR